MKRDTSTPTLSSRLRLVFEYDHQGRRIRKTFYTHNGSEWVEDRDTVFLYDGWNLLGELNANASNDRLRTYVWGLDLSGSEQGAGGVGGLLKVTDYTSGITHHFVAHDGNGNVAALVDAGTGSPTARYEYGPFGEPLRATGTLAEKNPFRFSTKYTDVESGLLYYGHRLYNPITGRWANRDPIEEKGGGNLYGFAANAPVNFYDPFGLTIPGTCKDCYPPYGKPVDPPKPLVGVNYVNCYDSELTGADRASINSAVSGAKERLGKVAAGTVSLPNNFTPEMASCLSGKLSGFYIRCATCWTPVSWFADAYAFPGDGGMTIYVNKIKGRDGASAMNGIVLLVLHELVHGCGKVGHSPPDNPYDWAAWLTVALPP